MISAVALNVTAVWPSAEGFVTVFPTDVERPNASNLNASAGQVVPNMVIARLGPDGAAEIYNNSGSVDLVLASQLVHHLAPEAIVAFGREASRIARRGVIIADLRRSALAQAGFMAFGAFASIVLLERLKQDDAKKSKAKRTK